MTAAGIAYLAAGVLLHVALLGPLFDPASFASWSAVLLLPAAIAALAPVALILLIAALGVLILPAVLIRELLRSREP